MFSEVVKLYCMICWSSGYSFDILVVMEARTAALVTIFRKKEKERKTSDVFCNTFRIYLMKWVFVRKHFSEISGAVCIAHSVIRTHIIQHNTLIPYAPPACFYYYFFYIYICSPFHIGSCEFLSLKPFPLISSVSSRLIVQKFYEHPEIDSGTIKKKRKKHFSERSQDLKEEAKSQIVK